MKTKTPDLFTATVHQILRAAQAEGATAEVVTDSFLRALERVYGPRALGTFRPDSKKPKKSSSSATPNVRLKLSRAEIALHNSFGESL